MVVNRSLGRVGSTCLISIFCLVSGAVWLLSSLAQGSQSLTLSWNPSPDTNVVGYNVYSGTSSGNYSSRISVGNTTHATIVGLQEGYTYFFAVTAVNCVGQESLPSNEVSYTVPGLSLGSALLCTNGLPPCLRVRSFGTPPAQWTLQQTTDLQSWQTVQCGTNCAVDVTVSVSTAPYRFFRLVTP